MLIFRELRRAKYLVLILLIGLALVEAAAQSAPLRKDIPSIAKAANGAIVTIVMGNENRPIAQGTGFLVSPDGAIATNYHVIAEGILGAVKFSDGTVLKIDGVLAADKRRDVAIVKVHGKTFQTLTLGNSERVQVGEEVVAIGNPLGLELTVSNGIVSGIRTDEKEEGKLLQITAPISHGSSGGPLFNMFGEVIGINALFLEGGENLNFAIPVNDAKLLLSHQSAKLQNLPNEHNVSLGAPKHSHHVPNTSLEIQKTLRWIQNTLNAGDGKKSIEYGEIVDSQTVLMPELNGCQVTFVTEFRNNLGLRSPLRWRVNLGDLDPTSIQVNNSYVWAYTTDKEPSISETLAKQGWESASINPVTEIYWFLSSEAYAERFVKALHRAITLCGGKASAF